MKLRKCSLLQRPSLVSGLRHGLEMPIRFATVYRDTYGERNNRAPLPLFRIEIHLFDRFPRSERERISIERFHGIRRKIRGIVNVATSRVTIFTDMHSHRDLPRRGGDFSRACKWLICKSTMYFHRLPVFYVFFFLRQIARFSNYLVRDSFNQRRFLFQIFLATCVGIFSSS